MTAKVYDVPKSAIWDVYAEVRDEIAMWDWMYEYPEHVTEYTRYCYKRNIDAIIRKHGYTDDEYEKEVEDYLDDVQETQNDMIEWFNEDRHYDNWAEQQYAIHNDR